VITGETTGSYAGASRAVLNALVSQYGGNTTYYFDKQTGVALEVYAVYSDYTLSLVATETNLWGGGLLGLDWWAWATIIVVVAVVAVAAALVLRRRKHTAPTPSQEVLPQPPASS
jgi:anti-sigma-K factor RskA